MMGTAAVAIGTVAAIPGTTVNLAAGGGDRTLVNFGHPWQFAGWCECKQVMGSGQPLKPSQAAAHGY